MELSCVLNSDVEMSQSLIAFIEESPCAFHAAESLRRRLDQAGFQELVESEAWEVERGGSYYVRRNGSSVLAFRIGEDVSVPQFRIALAHADSPSFRLKPHAELAGPGTYLRLDTEAYGGTIDRSWLDRPLSVAGRVLVDEGGRIESRLVAIERDIALIPSVAIHLARDVNEKGAIDRASDLYPVVSAGMLTKGAFDELVASEVGAEPGQVLGRDLYLYNRQQALVWGEAAEFVSAPRLDDLQCAFAAMTAFTDVCERESVAVFGLIDSEEVGSSTMQGALSPFVSQVLTRVSRALDRGTDAVEAAFARSFVISVDNAHATHPNHPELTDAENACLLNAGPVIKEAARATYATDALSRALVEHLCRIAGVPTQYFANRSDMRGGSTLGNLACRHLGMHTADVGLAQLAMHSAYETAGTRDTAYLANALRAYWSVPFTLAPGGVITFD